MFRPNRLAAFATVMAVLPAFGALANEPPRGKDSPVPETAAAKLSNTRGLPPPGTEVIRSDAAFDTATRMRSPRGLRRQVRKPVTLTEATGAAPSVGVAARQRLDAAEPPGQVSAGVCLQAEANCQPGDNFQALRSNGTTFVLADDFTLAASGSVSRICWWGAYGREVLEGTFVDCQGDAPDVFEIRYYADAGGLPGAMIASFTQAAPATLLVTGPVLTGKIVADQVPEFAFSASHAPVALEAGQCYWVEIVNDLGIVCDWFWEFSLQGNGRAQQDGDGLNGPDGYDLGESILEDLSFCLDTALGDATVCVPPGPPNDLCVNAEPLDVAGVFPFDNRTASADGSPPASCLPSAGVNLGSDVWYCWTAPCTDSVLVSTCGQTSRLDVDTMVAVYEGCGVCPPGPTELVVCNDDRCSDPADELIQNLQSMAVFDAMAGQDYLIRLGAFPGTVRGTGTVTISCGPPDNAACGTGGDCCDSNPTGVIGCDDERCCETVCACDPFCCEVHWDGDCAALGFRPGANALPSGCGAALLCADACQAVCGGTNSGDCCLDNGSKGCSDATCCEDVCLIDSFCCDVMWDDKCAARADGTFTTGDPAVCPQLCVNLVCSNGSVVFDDPPDRVVDARQPHAPGDASAVMGIDTFVVTAPSGADAGCFTLCQPTGVPIGNSVATVTERFGVYTVTLDRPIAPGAVTSITYTADDGTMTTARFASQPGNVNGDSISSAVDILVLLESLGNVAAAPPWGRYSTDIDHSGQTTAADMLRLLDLLNGADAFQAWLDAPNPMPAAECP